MEIKDILAYLRVIQNPCDSVGLKRIINVPKRGIGDTTVDKIQDYANKNNISLYDALLCEDTGADRAFSKLKNFVSLMEDFVKAKEDTKISNLIETILDKSGYISELENENTIEDQSRIENLKEFISVALEFEKTSEDQSLEAFLSGISLVSDLDSLQGQDNAVVLMTLHSAKGLEYPVVFLCGVEEGIFPSFRSTLEESEVEEERRLCYVGITRAREKLFITHASQRTIYGNTGYNAPSRFIREIPKDLLYSIGEEKEKSSHEIKPQKKQIETIFSNSFKEKLNIDSFKKPSPTLSSSVNFKIGDVVEHKKFGTGTVLDAQPMGGDVMLKINFQNVGVKQLMAAYAGLKIIS
jgi:DNA helicase-2/ATP-dependent DNA helicase PcrA